MHRFVLLPAVAILLLAGCTSAPSPAPTVTVTATPTAAAVAPACTSVVGHPTSEVIVDGSPYCITGTSVSTDKTGYITTNCDPVNNTSTVIYGWGTSDPLAPDQNTYAAKVGSVVVIVPVSASEKELFGGVTLVNYLVAVGCP